MDHNKLWKILKEMGIPDHLTSLLRHLYAGQEATVRTGRGKTDWFQIRLKSLLLLGGTGREGGGLSLACAGNKTIYVWTGVNYFMMLSAPALGKNPETKSTSHGALFLGDFIICCV